MSRASLLQKRNLTSSTRTMKGDIATAFERELDAIAHDRAFEGVEIVQHRARLVRGAAELSVTIDAAGGADLALCERFAARINANLGAIDPGYSLEVESAGLDRPLVRPADYARFAGSQVRVVDLVDCQRRQDASRDAARSARRDRRHRDRDGRAAAADGDDQIGKP